jgi:hypothetical protein
MGKASVSVRKKCTIICYMEKKFEKEGVIYRECPKCGRRTAQFLDVNMVRFDWLSGKTQSVARSPRPKIKGGDET